MNYKHSLFQSEFFGSIIAIRIFSRPFIASLGERERNTQWQTKANMSNPARLRLRADEKSFPLFKEEVDNSEKNARNEKKNYAYQEMVYCTGSSSPNNRILS